MNSSDRPLMITIFFLLGFGLVMIFSAGMVISLAVYEKSNYFFWHQLFYGVIPGIMLWIFFQNFNYHYLEKWAFPLFLITIVFLILVFIPGLGQSFKGAARWLIMGPISIQPTEIAKLSIILYLSAWLSRRKEKIKSFTESFLLFCSILLVMAVLIASQPDVGTLSIIMIISTVIYFLASGKITHLLLLAFSGILGLYILIKTEPYRLVRFMTFLDPNFDPKGSGYQINQALIAIGSGGIGGVGLGHSRQKFLYLPETVGDSIYAVICEELGMIGGMFVVLLFMIIAWRGFMIAKNAPDLFGRLVAGGITAWFVFQAFINIGGITALIPLTGIPLTFISYGSSALVISLIGAGILLNISRFKEN